MIGEENKFSDFSTLTKVAGTYDPKKSITEILEVFKCMSDEYQKSKEIKDIDYKYSNINYKLCTQAEKEHFNNSELFDTNCLVINSIYEKSGLVWNWANIFDLLSDKLYKTTDKINRKVVYPTSGCNRPIGDISYMLWNGFQIIDLDIKNAEFTEKLKPILFKELSKYNWFLGCTKSASGKGLHLWTKINPITVKAEQRKIEYICNFRHKYSYVYLVLLTYMNEIGYTKNNILSYIDMAMAKPQQGIFIPSDDEAMMSTNFKDKRLDVNFESAFSTGVESIDWITHPDLKSVFAKLEWFNNDEFVPDTDVKYDDITINDRDASKNIRKHYKHAQRWQLANTLTALFGADKALVYLIEVCKGTDRRELNADIKTATIHNKPISLWAVSELNNYHGFDIVINNDSEVQKKKLEEIQTTLNTDVKTDPTRIISDKISDNKVELHIKANQFLSDIKDDILNNLSHISLLEAGAGYGKTEMVKSFGGKTLLILPFTSTIKAKVESSKTTSDWLYYYGNKCPALDELLSNKSMSMTIDKFSRLNVFELDQAQFDYIVIDESHLLFTSSYRNVMSPCIQRLANCKAKVIMMTGTPTGEMLFFPNIKHIKVIKEDCRDKTFDVVLAYQKLEVMVEMCKSMAKDILEGRKILFPTNNGNLYYRQITGLVQEYINRSEHPKQINSFYYKKSNYGDDSMDNININKTIGDNDIILCTTYLSVGVDICDKYNFAIYFAEQMIAQDIEQFANRIRNNDLHIKLYLPQVDDAGIPFNYHYTQPFNLGFDTSDLMYTRDMLKTANDLIERNDSESKYNPMIQNILSTNRYLKYDENDCKYYIDETTYKLKVFEDRYSEYAKQLDVILENMRCFGYVTNIISISSVIDDSRREEIEEYVKNLRTTKYSEDTEKTKELLNHINDNNIDLYRELLKGNYTLFRDDAYKDIIEDSMMWVEDIELMEKNLPIILSFYKYYTCEVIKDIYDYCTNYKTGRINYSMLNRVRSFANIDYNRRQKRLDFPVLKFLKDCQLWSKIHFITTKEEIDDFLNDWTVSWANSIKDVIIDDVKYLETLNELAHQYWKVIVTQTRSKKGQIRLTPFELLWETRETLDTIYGGYLTKEFFADELLTSIKEENEEDDEELPAFPHTAKYRLSDIESQLVNVVHKDYDYFKYSDEDGSNKRFMIKQENTNKLNNVFVSKQDDTTDTPETEQQLSIDFDTSPLPF